MLSGACKRLDHTHWRTGYQGAGLQRNATGVSVGVKHLF